jgi:hypothetical protein
VVLMERAKKKNKERWSMSAAASRFNGRNSGERRGGPFGARHAVGGAGGSGSTSRRRPAGNDPHVSAVGTEQGRLGHRQVGLRPQ